MYSIQKHEEFQFYLSATFIFLWSIVSYASHLCRSNLSLRISSDFGMALSSKPWPLTKTSTWVYPIYVSPTMTLVQVSSLASCCSSWTTPFPRFSPSSTPLACQSLEASLFIFHSHPSLPQMALLLCLLPLHEEQPLSVLAQLISQSYFPQVGFYRCFACFGWGRNGSNNVQGNNLTGSAF